jgi:hypothetical protein
MESKREYRVYCPLPRGRTTAVSQYKWHQPSLFGERLAEELSGILERIMQGIRKLHGEILEEVRSGRGGDMDKLLLEQGFSFDVFYDEDTGQCSLVELNVFGARSGLGSCLFHWIRDMDVLYGKGKGAQERQTKGGREIEFRISV